MSGRRFHITTVRRAEHGPRQTAAELVCSKCGEKDHVILAQRQSLPPEAIQSKFAQAGWNVGKGPSDDICPACRTKHLKDRRERSTLRSVEKEEPMEKAPKLAAVPPREMSRDDRRLIFAKLEEVYVSESVGYTPGWSDERVAKEMSVPRAWVEKIRDENFGPVKDNAETRKLFEAINALQKEQSEILKRVVLGQKEFDYLESKLKELYDKVDALLRVASEIRKAVA